MKTTADEHKIFFSSCLKQKLRKRRDNVTLRKFRKCSSSILKDITSAKATNWRENRAKPKQTLNSYTILDTVYDSNPLKKKYYNPGGCDSGGAGLIKTPLCSSKKNGKRLFLSHLRVLGVHATSVSKQGNERKSHDGQ